MLGRFRSSGDTPHVLWLTLEGWVVGALSALVFLAVDRLWAAAPAVLLALITTLFLMAARPESDLARVCDAFGGGWGRDAILRILGDPHVGTFGAIGLVGGLALKFMLLLELTATPVGFALALLAGQSLGRLSGLVMSRTLPPVTDGAAEGRAFGFAGGRVALFCAALGGLAPLALLAAYQNQPWIFAALLPVVGVHLYLARMFRRGIAGVTRDCLGATAQIGELVLYLGLQPTLAMRLGEAGDWLTRLVS